MRDDGVFPDGHERPSADRTCRPASPGAARAARRPGLGPTGGAALALVLVLAGVAGAAPPVFAPPAPLNGNATYDSGDDTSPQLATDGHGTWIAVWASTDTLGETIGSDPDILLARSSDHGVSWTAPAPLVAAAATDRDFDFAPYVATDGAGTWLVAWASTSTLGAPGGGDPDILVVRSTDGGATWSVPAALNTNAAGDRGSDDRPQLATDGAGTWVAVWDSSDTLGDTIGTDRDILVARSTDGGVTWSAPAALNSNAAIDRGLDHRPRIATDRQGRWVAVWASTDTLGGTIGSDFDVLVARSTDAGASWTAPVPLAAEATTDTALDDRPQLATDRAGAWIVVWVSNAAADGSTGDLDLRVARSRDAGASWSAPAALDPEAGRDDGEDAAPQLASDGHGRWVVVWESTATLGGTLGSDNDILVAHSTDGGVSWSAARPLDAGAASDAGRDVAPQVATDGQGLWIVVWASDDPAAGRGGDLDVLRAAGRERCGDGVLDPGEHCDDGNVRDGDGCPASCERSPVATPTATRTPVAPAPTPTDDGAGGGGGGATPTATPAATGAAMTPAASATPTATHTADPAASATPAVDPPPTATAVAPTPTRPAPTTPAAPTATASPPAAAPSSGGLPNPLAATLAVRCQRAIHKAGVGFVGKQLAALAGCARGVQKCVQTRPGDPGCLERAGAGCGRALDRAATREATVARAIEGRCGGVLTHADLLDPRGLGYASLAATCRAEGDAGVDTLGGLVACVVRHHRCQAERLIAILAPRTRELMRLPAALRAGREAPRCLPDHGGSGLGLGDPDGAGRALDRCGAAVVKTGASLARRQLQHLGRCVDAAFGCIQLAPDDARCAGRAARTCAKRAAQIAAAAAKLATVVAQRCGPQVVDFPTLQAAEGAHLEALADGCGAHGIALDSLDAYRRCLDRTLACGAEALLRIEMPRAAELRARAGAPVSVVCPAGAPGT